MEEMEKAYFPMFVDIKGMKILVVGGGNIALRRVKTLLEFGADVQVIAPELCAGMKELAAEGKIRSELREYMEGDAESAGIVIAATDSRAVNRAVQEECRHRKIPVNVADDRDSCDFYFPSVVITDEAVIGINSGGEDPGRVKRVRSGIEALYGNRRDYSDDRIEK